MFRKPISRNLGTASTAGRTFVLCLLLGLGSTDLRADVSATLDRTTIAAGDTVTLTIQAEGQQSQGAQPDLPPLRQDFTILGTSTSQQMQIINGRMSSSASLRVELEPKHGGRIEIPALKAGNDTTAPLTLTVADQPAATASQPGSSLYLETEVEPQGGSTFVQQQIQYTTRLYSSIPLIEGALGDPQPEHAVVERLGEDKHYQTTVNGQRYQVIERNYAIFPEQSGTFTIPSVSFTGRAATGGGAARRPFGRMDSMIEQFFGRDPFSNDSFFATPFGDPGKRVHASSKTVTVKVKPHPASYTAATWLPGEDLTLHDSWATQPPEFRVGEPVTRVISIDAKGLAASHLPDVTMPAIANMRIYPEEPRRESRTDGAVVYGHSEQSFAFVPQKAGKVTLPEIRLSWWDIKAGKEMVAVLPSWNVVVLPGTGGVQGAPVTPTAAVSKPTAQPVVEPPASAAPAAASAAINTLKHVWPWIAGGAILLMFVALFMWRRSRRKPSAAVAAVDVKPAMPVTAPGPDAGVALRALRQACDENNARAAARALLDWAAAEWPGNPPRNLGAVASRLKNDAAAEVRRLDQSLYAPGGVIWDGASLGNAFKTTAVKQSVKPATAAGGLAPLYPEWGKRLR